MGCEKTAQNALSTSFAQMTTTRENSFHETSTRVWQRKTSRFFPREKIQKQERDNLEISTYDSSNEITNSSKTNPSDAMTSEVIETDATTSRLEALSFFGDTQDANPSVEQSTMVVQTRYLNLYSSLSILLRLNLCTNRYSPK